ncbi:hypothetical protein SDC9_191819 [bioreactor metagenome]|uniref:Uncharacterized protein n=1 Tax=bioreactor metagenome TaxID=1076179 RepID=A0A645HZ04_9ZZZZ
MQTQGNCRQNDAVPIGVAGRRQPPKFKGEQQHKQQSKPENRDGDTQQSDNHAEAVNKGVLLDSRNDTEGNR